MRRYGADAPALKEGAQGNGKRGHDFVLAALATGERGQLTHRTKSAKMRVWGAHSQEFAQKGQG